MKPEWRRWSLPQGIIDQEIIETNMVFAVRPQNIHSIPKLIQLLRKMGLIIALVPKETPRQCTQCEEYLKKLEEQIGGAEHVCTGCLFFYILMREN